jgi:hypothetical protein
MMYLTELLVAWSALLALGTVVLYAKLRAAETLHQRASYNQQIAQDDALALQQTWQEKTQAVKAREEQYQANMAAMTTELARITALRGEEEARQALSSCDLEYYTRSRGESFGRAVSALSPEARALSQAYLGTRGFPTGRISSSEPAKQNVGRPVEPPKPLGCVGTEDCPNVREIGSLCPSCYEDFSA